MTTYFISRHRGAWDWARRKGFEDATVLQHLDPATLKTGDVVLGTLPVSLAGEVCARGCAFHFLTLDVPQARRGDNLTAEEMDQFGARLERYDVRRVEGE